MSDLDTSLVDFYKRHGISPVRQDISNLETHFTRRAGLYRHLGILPQFVRGRTVLEVGPGGGFNSLYTATLQPSRYVLLEPNPTGVTHIEKVFGQFPPLRKKIEICGKLVEDYDTNDRFDFVLCEGMLALAGVKDPSALLRTVAKFVAPAGGVLVITCIDAISDFPETLRRLFGQLLINPKDPLETQAAMLTPMFGPHLNTLAGMSRPHDDWVIDNLLNPASIGPYLPIFEAIAAIEQDFEFFAASPHFATDWRWYKALTPKTTEYSRRGIEQYWENAHSLFDYRRTFPSRDPAANKELYRQCDETRALVREYEARRDTAVVPRIVARLGDLERSVRAFSADVGDALKEAHDLLSTAPPDPQAVAAAWHFGPWFGRGQQYLSFSRR
jgi:SAM-dependent methyltransferase